MVPLSLQSKFRSIERRAANAERQLKEDASLDDFCIEVSGIVVEIRLVLDRAYKDIWLKYRDEGSGNKPNLYFPVSNDEEKFKARLRKDQLAGLEVKNAKLYDALREMQVFSSDRDGSWLKHVHDISALKHDRDATFELDSINTTFGVGDNPNGVLIKSLSIGPRGIEVDPNDVIDPVTGKPIEIIYERVVIEALEGTKISPQRFVSIALVESRRLVGRIYSAIR